MFIHYVVNLDYVSTFLKLKLKKMIRALYVTESTFTPIYSQRNRNATLDIPMLHFLKKTVENVGSQTIKPKSNINAKERQSLQQLKTNTDMIFKQADKGGAFVIMDVDLYALKIQDHLKDETTYQKLKCNNDDEIKKKIIKMIGKYEEYLTEK